MDIIGRVKNICLTPQTEWSVIAAEQTPPATLVTGYVLPLAAISAIAGFIGGSLIGQSVPFLGTIRMPLATGLSLAVYALVAAVAGVLLLGLIINALAPTFGAEKNSAQAFKVAVYSFTPAWVAGVFQILPVLGVLAILGALYGLYLLYLGLPRLMRCPEEKAVGYTAVVVVCAIVVSIVTMLISGAVIGTGRVGSDMVSGALGGATPASEASTPFDPNSTLGKMTQGLEDSANKMEAAGKSGNPGAQVAAAMEGLGTLFGGGARVDPVSLDMLKPFVPETFAGLSRTSSNAQRTGMGGLMVSKAEATYGAGPQQVTLEITDTGGVSGLMGMANWMGVQEERESEDGYERTQNVSGRMTHVKSSKSGQDEFGVVIGERFMVNATSHALDVEQLRAAVGRLDLGKLEALKASGVQKP